MLAVYANASFAFSVGDAMLKSYLGEPLLVKLTVSDVEKSPDPSCFSVSDTNDIPAFKKAATSVTANKDGFQLTITTQSIISEPILNLRVSYHCDPHLSRDYVLLLDPRETSTPALQTGDTHKPARESSDRSNLGGLSDPDNLSTASSATARPTKKTAKAKNLNRNQATLPAIRMTQGVGLVLIKVASIPAMPIQAVQTIKLRQRIPVNCKALRSQWLQKNPRSSPMPRANLTSAFLVAAIHQLQQMASYT